MTHRSYLQCGIFMGKGELRTRHRYHVDGELVFLQALGLY